MFFALSKIIGILLNPIIWILFMLVIALVAKSRQVKKRMIIASLIVICFFGNGFVLNEVLLRWEKQAVSDEQLNFPYDYGVVLSGMVWSDSVKGKVNFLHSSDRIWQAVRLYQEGKIKKILISGGDAGFYGKYEMEALVLKKFLIKIGIPDSDIFTELESRNTHENALYTKAFLRNQHNAKLLLITSAIHMRRSEKCFEKVNLSTTIYPVDSYSGTRSYTIDHLFIPKTTNILKWDMLIHEFFGMLSYKIVGYI